MASTSQKKTTKKTSGKSGSRTTAKKPQPRPIRREVGGVVCLVLALCVFVSYFGISAIFIDWLAVLIKGLLGYGYWLFGPALVLAGCILLFHHGRPVTLRVTSALLLPVLLGTLCHMLLVKEAYASSIGIIPAMWKDGVALKCGGVISGALGQGSVAVFSKIASIIIFTVLFVVLLMVALRLTVGALIEKHRERPKYEEEPEPEKPEKENVVNKWIYSNLPEINIQIYELLQTNTTRIKYPCDLEFKYLHELLKKLCECTEYDFRLQGNMLVIDFEVYKMTCCGNAG